jgi:hypothetical protein
MGWRSGAVELVAVSALADQVRGVRPALLQSERLVTCRARIVGAKHTHHSQFVVQMCVCYPQACVGKIGSSFIGTPLLVG